MLESMHKFIDFGFTHKSEIVSYKDELKNYHPALSGNLNKEKWKVKTMLGKDAEGHYIMLFPISTDWTGPQKSLFSDVKFRKTTDLNKMAAKFDPVDLTANLNLIGFDLNHVKSKLFGKEYHFIAELKWQIKKTGETLSSKWFWIPD